MTSDMLLSREEILAGLPAKRANTLLFLIRSRTAHLVAKSRRALEMFLTDEGAEERDLAFFEAFAMGREPPLSPTLQDLERFAPQWASLVPDNPNVQAAMAHVLGEENEFTAQDVPNIREALSLDEEEVQQAYQRLYGEPLESIFAPRTGPLDRLRWAWAGLTGWLESLSPFWTAYALTLTETVGAGILALPIAMASVGPLAGVVLLFLLGLINVLTIASMSESISRSGSIRYGQTFLGRVVSDYLGDIGSFILTLGIGAYGFVGLLVYYIGFSTTLADATSLPAEIWAALLFLIGLYFLRGGALSAAIASALVVGAVNIGLILVLSLVAFSHVQMENLLYLNVPWVGGQPFDPSIIELIFGVVLMAFFGHLSTSNCAQIVFRRDPSARSLIWGNVAATMTAIALYSIWVMAVNGAIMPQTLAEESGTALAPLATELGPIVHVLGSLFAVLAMGMASLHVSIGLSNLVRERLPSPRQAVLMLSRSQGRILFHSRGRAKGQPSLALTYLGLDGGAPRFRLYLQLAGKVHRMEKTIAESWDVAAWLAKFQDKRGKNTRLTLEVMDADQMGVRLRIDSSMRLTYEGGWEAAGLRMADVLSLPDELRSLVNWMTREGPVSLSKAAAHIGQDQATTQRLLESLVEQDLVKEELDGRTLHYSVHFAPRRRRELPDDIWQALDDSDEAPTDEVQSEELGPLQRLIASMGESGRFILAVSPIVLLFLTVEWLLFTNSESYSGPISFIGVIVASLLGGIFPMLMLVSSRRKGEYVPGVVYRFLGHPLVVVGIYMIFLAGILLHGLVIWQAPFQRVCAVLAGVGILGLTVDMIRRGSLAPRTVVELRQDADVAEGEDRAIFTITASGRPQEAQVELGYAEGVERCRAAAGQVDHFSALRHATFDLTSEEVKELKVWVHRITPEGDSQPIPAIVEGLKEREHIDLELSDGQAITPVPDDKRRLKITFPEAS